METNDGLERSDIQIIEVMVCSMISFSRQIHGEKLTPSVPLCDDIIIKIDVTGSLPNTRTI